MDLNKQSSEVDICLWYMVGICLISLETDKCFFKIVVSFIT